MIKSSRFWIATALIFIFPLFFVGGPTPYSTSLFRELWDLGHLFFFIAFVVLLNKKFPISGWKYGLKLSIFVFLLGCLIETLQHFTGRNSNWLDVFHNLLGAWLALFFLQKANPWVWAGRLITAAFLLPIAYSVLLTAGSQYHLSHQFPLLANFESVMDSHAWKGNVERIPFASKQNQYVLKIHFTTEKYSTVSFGEFFNSWHGYEFLSMDIYNPSEKPLDINLRINDVPHKANNRFEDRFNRRIQLISGWNSIVIPIVDIQKAPAQRQLQLDAIASLAIFTMHLSEPQDIYLDNVLLR
jgi:hypothetical protein